jgi:SAM-dependent methyltransferase
MEPTELNRRAWDEAHRRGTKPLGDKRGLPPQVRRALADLSGKRVLDLQCGTGESAAALAELGATVTAVDVSDRVLALARERWPAVLWIPADVHELPGELRRGRFDLVYTGDGVLDRIYDVDAWAHAIASALRPGGDLLLFDEHPVAKCVDGLMHWRESYFDERAPVAAGSRFWRLGQILSALAAAGLVLRTLQEYPQQHGNRRRQDARLPGTFLLHARRT